jgi:hypothetical protein
MRSLRRIGHLRCSVTRTSIRLVLLLNIAFLVGFCADVYLAPLAFRFDDFTQRFVRFVSRRPPFGVSRRPPFGRFRVTGLSVHRLGTAVVAIRSGLT